MDLASEVLGPRELGLLRSDDEGEGALDDSSVVPGSAVDGLAVLVPQRHVHVLLAGD